MPARQRAGRGEDAEADEDQPEAGHQPQVFGGEPGEEGEQRGAGDAGRNEMQHGLADHLVGEADMVAARAAQHLGADQAAGGDGGGDPGGEVGQRLGGAGEQQGLRPGDAEGEGAGGCQRGRAEAEELA